jgi:hypothetical protein
MIQNNENSAKVKEICQNIRSFGVKIPVKLTRRGIRELANFDFGY